MCNTNNSLDNTQYKIIPIPANSEYVSRKVQITETTPTSLKMIFQLEYTYGISFLTKLSSDLTISSRFPVVYHYVSEDDLIYTDRFFCRKIIDQSPIISHPTTINGHFGLGLHLYLWLSPYLVIKVLFINAHNICMVFPVFLFPVGLGPVSTSVLPFWFHFIYYLRRPYCLLLISHIRKADSFTMKWNTNNNVD